MIKALSKDVLRVDASIRVRGKQYRMRTTLERQTVEDLRGTRAETTQEFRNRAAQWTAEARARLIEEHGPSGQAKRKGTKSVRQIVDQYMDACKRSVNATTYRSKQERLGHWLAFCKLRSILYIDQFTRSEAQKYWDWLIDSGFVGRGPVIKFDTLQSAILYEIQEENRSISLDPCKNISCHSEVIEEDVKPMPDGMFHAFMSSTRDLFEFNCFKLLAGSGVRTGEARHLPTSRVSPRGFIRVAPYNGWKPKTPKSKRSIPENQMSRDAIDYLLSVNGDKEYLLGGDAPLPSNWFVHRFEAIRLIVARNYPEWSDEIMSKREGGKRFWYTSHNLRKNFITWGLESGIPMFQMSAVAGHTHSYMTEKYGKASDENTSSLMPRFDERTETVTPSVTVH